MFKRYCTFLGVGIFLFMTLYGCSTNVGPEESSPDVLEKLKVGELKGLTIKIGSTKKEAIEEFGTPVRTGNSEYGFTMYYESFSLEFEDYANSLEELHDDSKIVSIYAEPTIIGLTGTPGEIKKMLGPPSREVLDDTGNDTFILEYKGNDCLLRFIFENAENPVDFITIRMR